MENKNKVENTEDLIELLTNQIDSVMEKVESIPDPVLNALTQRSFKDAQKIFNNELTLEKVTYAIYRAYVLGIAVGAEKKDEIFN